MRLAAAALVVLALATGATAAPDYLKPGKLAVGVTTVTLTDASRGDRTLPVELWYPARSSGRDATPLRRRRPLVLVVHGLCGSRLYYDYLVGHLASWGFVVAAPDYLERGLGNALGQAPQVRYGDVELGRATVDLVKAENARAGSLLEGIVSAERIAITGHSAGGGSAILFGGEPDVVTFIPMSAGVRGAGGDIALPDKPSLWLTGAADGVVPLDGVEATYDLASPPKRIVVLDNAGHLAPSDLCAIGASGGGIVAIAIEAGLPVPEQLQRLGTDGCQAGALPPADGWPIVKHFVTAQLRWAFGIDPQPVGLSQDAARGLPEATFTYREER